MGTGGTEEHRDVMNLPDFGNQNKTADMIRHKGCYSLPWMLSGTPSTQDECFPSIRKRNRGRGEGGGGDLALQSAQSQDVQEGKKLEIFILVLNIC